MKFLSIVLIFTLALVSCEKEINFDLNNADDVLVVDASIENGVGPQVVLTKSLDYFSSIQPGIINDLFVHNATVIISNGVKTHTLKEYAIPVSGGYNFYSYGIDTANPGTAFTGAFNTNYTLTIVADGKTYNATTSIPLLAKTPDSLWWKKAPFQADTSKVVIMIKTTDPPGLGNYIRYFTRRNSEPLLPGANSVFDDQVIDGTTYELQVDPGVDKNDPPPADSNYFKRGDTVTLKLCNIDRDSYKFWSTWEFAFQSIGNPFAQPNKVLGNISNGALGAFYGYAAYYQTLVVPK
jgi:hypothetical protein